MTELPKRRPTAMSTSTSSRPTSGRSRATLFAPSGATVALPRAGLPSRRGPARGCSQLTAYIAVKCEHPRSTNGVSQLGSLRVPSAKAVQRDRPGRPTHPLVDGRLTGREVLALPGASYVAIGHWDARETLDQPARPAGSGSLLDQVSGDGGNRTRVRSRAVGSVYERSRRSGLVPRSPRRRGSGEPALCDVPGSARADLTG